MFQRRAVVGMRGYVDQQSVQRSSTATAERFDETRVLELEFYLFDRQLHNIGEIISKCKIICHN